MTAHELARKLLEGPDVPVAYANQSYDESEVCVVDHIEQNGFWQFKYTVSERWSEPECYEPNCPEDRKRRVAMVRLS